MARPEARAAPSRGLPAIKGITMTRDVPEPRSWTSPAGAPEHGGTPGGSGGRP
ncbi:hypothetical protein [Nonomuraea sp. NPDC049695]|uniref:hypothetical protein n=1 Tax=Nonomuraea sp. NPDC049695 TaxID=3154734 RepID=UPI0034443AC1